jgi:hypothetical protein
VGTLTQPQELGAKGEICVFNSPPIQSLSWSRILRVTSLEKARRMVKFWNKASTENETKQEPFLHPSLTSHLKILPTSGQKNCQCDCAL